MKRILSLVMVAVITVMAVAQDTKPHLQFKGIPIQGSISEFCKKLEEKGFYPVYSTETDLKIFKGDFTGRQATVGVKSTEDGKNVFGVTVLFEESSDWNTLESLYNYYKDLYTTKYGKPKTCIEDNREKNRRYSSNTSLMYELSQGRVTWCSQYKVEGGNIKLSIEKSGISEGVVVIKYQDSQNVEQKRQNDLDDI